MIFKPRILLFGAFVIAAIAAVVTMRWSRHSRVFSEQLINEWGYVTTGIDEGGHHIRSIKNFGSSSEAFYARFDLQMQVFGSPVEASAAIAEIRASSSTHPLAEKDYRQFIQRGARLFIVNTWANYTRLDHMPSLIKKIERHLDTQVL